MFRRGSFGAACSMLACTLAALQHCPAAAYTDKLRAEMHTTCKSLLLRARTPCRMSPWGSSTRPNSSGTARVVAVSPPPSVRAEDGHMSPSRERVEPQRVLIDRILHSKLTDYLSDSQSLDGRKSTYHQSAVALDDSMHSSEMLPEDEQSETCVSAHPGSVCCSTTSVHKDPATRSVIINCTTTVRLTNPNSNVSMTDLEQLGYLAAAQRMQEQAASLSTVISPQHVQARHDAVLSLLSKGRVIRADKSINQFGHITFRCVLEHPVTKHKMRAMIKPYVEGHADGWHRADAECSAYRLSRLLGMDYVPPCVYRRDVDVDWQHFDGATFMYWAEGGQELRTQPMDKWGLPWEVVLSDARILDVLIQNSDRHHGHFLLAEHWAHGQGVSPATAGWRGTLRPVFIDHAAGFRPEAYVDLRHQNAFNTGETRHISARTFLRLRCLDRGTVAAATEELLTCTELDQVMRRRDEILTYFDALIAEHGYNSVVIEGH